jgi:hypothetical protein
MNDVDVLTETQRQAAVQAQDAVRADPSSIRIRFPAAARTIARTPVDPSDLGQVRAEDQVRVSLLEALAEATPDPEALTRELEELYRYGDADERRAVLLALSHLPIADRGIELVRDALRSNDPRLVLAALGEYGQEHLDPAGWRQGVLKCLFMEAPLAQIPDLLTGSNRVDPTLVDMVAAFAAERTAAGRTVPADARRILDLSTGKSLSTSTETES